MNTRTNKTVLLITLMICLATAVYSAVGTFTFRTPGASDTTEVVDLRYPQKVPEDASVTTDSIADGSITNAKLAEPVAIEKGGTGKTTAAEALAALGGASLNGSSTVAFTAKTFSEFSPAGTLKTVAVAQKVFSPGEIATISAGITSGNIWADIYLVNITNGTTAKFFMSKTGTMEIVDALNIFSATKDTASSINCYLESDSLCVQMNRTATTTMRVYTRGVLP